MGTKLTIVEGNSNDKDNVRVIMVKGEKGEMGDLNHNDIIDNLESTATNKVLSANQGKILKDLVDTNTANISTNTANISTNTAKINNETRERQSADTSLQSQISTLASGTPLVASSISGMTDTTKPYVNTSDGYWYYYNGSAWVQGGVYQSTEIANNSIGLDKLKDEVINDRYENNLSNNVLNPFLCQENKKLRQVDGTILDDTNYWSSGKIHLNNGEQLRIYKFNNGRYSATDVYRICAYQEDNTFIETQDNSNIYTATQNCYVIITMQKSICSFANRFSIGAVVYTSENPYVASMRYPFFIYTSSNKENINLNVAYKDLNENLKGKLPINEDFMFEIGSYFSATGLLNNVANRIRTSIYINLFKGTTIKTLDNDVEFVVLDYSINNGYVTFKNSTGFISNYKFTENKYVNIVIRYTDNRDLTDNDIDTLVSKIEISSPIENIQNSVEDFQNYIDENTKIGTELSYSGEKIELNNKCYVSSPIGITSKNQDGCIYNNIIFEFGTDGSFSATNIESLTNYGTFYLDEYETITPHCNSACFGNEFYDSNDEFPLLYINAYNAPNLTRGTCYVHRVQRNSNNQFSTTLVQTITIGFTNNEIWADNSDTRPYGNFAVDTDHNYLYVFTLRNTLNITRFFKFRLPRLSDGETVTLTQNDIIEYFDTPFEPYIQGCQYYQNKIYSSCGNNLVVANSSSIRVIDLVAKGEVTKIPTSSICSEPETIAFYNNKIVFGEINLVYIDF